MVAQGVDGPAARLGVVPHLFGPTRSVLRRAAEAEAVLQGLAVDMIHDIGLGWRSDVLQSEDRFALGPMGTEAAPVACVAAALEARRVQVLPRYQDFRRLMARQFGNPQRVVIAVSQMCRRTAGATTTCPSTVSAWSTTAPTRRVSPARRNHCREPTRDRLGICEDEVVLLFVGHDYQRKGLATAVRAANCLAAEGAPVRLLVVGGKRRRFRPKLDLPQGVAINVGAIDDPVPYYAAADVFVLPTFYDPCPV